MQEVWGSNPNSSTSLVRNGNSNITVIWSPLVRSAGMIHVVRGGEYARSAFAGRAGSGPARPVPGAGRGGGGMPAGLRSPAIAEPGQPLIRPLRDGPDPLGGWQRR